MSFLFGALQFVLFLFMMALLGRVIVSLVMAFAHDWRPTGAALVAVEGVLTVTDPPIKAVRKVVPPLSLGQVRIDLAFLIVFLAVSLLYQVVSAVAMSR
ncbi:YggT family protein [Demequina sp. SYSU T00192]|uniref:YggT family protein n=1 Tax=Demequina litoralis TaxID=3051660 RepID=A0ABT8GAN0_9MICO|nr:YggT family protein [Demequina sp. SYSU T00192]MDN4476195.1 YggT family protein [Demequina sp. SYSU T00192]